MLSPRARFICWILGIFLVKSILAESHPPSEILQRLPIQSGDLIFREGTEPVSDLVLNLDNGGYSHVGMLIYNQTTNQWQVLHATPSEIKGRPDSVVIDDLKFFIAPQNAKKYTLYQVDATTAQHRLAAEYATQQLGTPFDITGKAGTYCTLLIVDAWLAAQQDLQVIPTHISLPLVGGSYLLPRDLRASPKLKQLYISHPKNHINQ